VLLQFVSVLFLTTSGTSDVKLWLYWIEAFRTHGMRGGYAIVSQESYPPFCYLMLIGVDQFARASGITTHLALKISLLLGLWLTTGLFWLITRNILLTAFLQASLILNSVGLGYLDVYCIPVLLLALWAIQRRRMALGLFLFGAACLIKPQPVILAPFILLYLWRTQTLHLKTLAPAALLGAASVIVFGRPVIDAALNATANPYLSGQALNFNWILTYVLNVYLGRPALALDQAMILAPSIALLPSKLFSVGVYGYILYLARPDTFTRFLQTTCLGYLAYYTFNTGVHENHLALVLVLLAWLAADHQFQRDSLFVALFLNLNLLIFYGFDGQAQKYAPWPYLDVLLACLWVFWFGLKLTAFQKANPPRLLLFNSTRREAQGD
jgi:hypothetical protein